MTFTHTLHVIQEGIQPIVAPIDNDAPVEPEGPQSDDDDDEPQSVLQGRLRALAEAGDDDDSSRLTPMEVAIVILDWMHTYKVTNISIYIDKLFQFTLIFKLKK